MLLLIGRPVRCRAPQLTSVCALFLRYPETVFRFHHSSQFLQKTAHGP